MNAKTIANKNWKLNLNTAIATAIAAFMLGATGAYADPPIAMAPPVASSDQDSGGAVTSDSVFNWTDVPENQKVPVNRAAFDEGGYQIYDTAGETIVVPFKNQNLYVMKFARSDDDSMYFINRGDVPVLYIPDGGYLENATVSGARWYPFPHDYHPTGAVYVGPAASWDLFIGMGWYPGMRYYGGYWCDRPLWDGGIFVAFPGLFFEIGGHSCYGWDNYRFYCNDHPGWFHPGFYDRNIYHWAGRPSLSRPPFGSVSHGFGGGHFGGHSDFQGAGHFGSGDHSGFRGGSSDFHGAVAGHGDGGFRGGSSGYHTFHGADGSGGSFGGSHSFGGGSSHTFRGASDSHSFGGGGGSHGGGGHSFGGGGHGGGDHGGDHGGHGH